MQGAGLAGIVILFLLLVLRLIARGEFSRSDDDLPMHSAHVKIIKKRTTLIKYNIHHGVLGRSPHYLISFELDNGTKKTLKCTAEQYEGMPEEETGIIGYANDNLKSFIRDKTSSAMDNIS